MSEPREVTSEDVYRACDVIVRRRDRPALNYAVNYAIHCREMVRSGAPASDLHTQVLYVLNNLGQWRGDEARAVRVTLRAFVKKRGD